MERKSIRSKTPGTKSPPLPPISGKSGGKNGLKKENKLFRGIDEPPGDEGSKRVLADFLKNHDQGLWDRSSDELKKGLLQQ